MDTAQRIKADNAERAALVWASDLTVYDSPMVVHVFDTDPEADHPLWIYSIERDGLLYKARKVTS